MTRFDQSANIILIFIGIIISALLVQLDTCVDLKFSQNRKLYNQKS